jgi:metallophosphoesterase (TIGR00282 family)
MLSGLDLPPRLGHINGMKVLFIGDVVGRPGVQAVQTFVPRLIAAHKVDIVIANAENSEGGAGISPESAESILAAEVNLLTSGNHIWTKRQIVPWLEANPELLLRPANYPAGAPGKGHAIARSPDGRKLGVINVEGRVFMRPLDDPFTTAAKLVKELRAETPCILVDMHCEATSEKNAMGAFLDGKVSAVVGTHTHVQTADERILPGRTAFITDVGMAGPLDSVIGMKKEVSVERFLSQRPVPSEVAKNLVYLQGVVITIDDATGKAQAIERIRERLSGT